MQHFLDRVTKILVQTEPWRVAGPSSLKYQLRTSPPSSAIAQSILTVAVGAEGEVRRQPAGHAVHCMLVR